MLAIVSRRLWQPLKTVPLSRTVPRLTITYSQSQSSQRNCRYFFNTSKPPAEQGPKKDDESIPMAPMKAVGEQEPSTEKLAEENLGPKIGQQEPMQSSSFGTTAIIASSAVLLFTFIYLEVISVNKNTKKKEMTGNVKVTSKGKALIGGEWKLTDTEGKEFGSENLKGKYYMIYFGFTHCPDICPNSLSKLAAASKIVKQSSEASFFELKSVFVSVDPDRDSAEKIKKFVSIFDPSMIGVTGKSNQDEPLRECMKKFKIYASKIEFEDPQQTVLGRKSYTIDHTILTYLMNEDNQYIAHLGANLGEYDLSKLILEKIREDRQSKMQQLKV